MTQQDKDLLLRDLSARLPYGVILDYSFIEDKQRIHTKIPLTYRNIGTVALDEWHTNEEIFKPYLRPMSSMTEKEKKDYELLCDYYMDDKDVKHYFNNIATIDWYHQKHFDCRGLIKLGLALEAPEGMYNIKD